MFDDVLGVPRDGHGSDLRTDLQHLPHSARTVVHRGVGRRADDEVAELPRPIAASSELDGVGVGAPGTNASTTTGGAVPGRAGVVGGGAGRVMFWTRGCRLGA